jgi:DNA (cytosine-5)-methyltransferase 1
VSDVAVSAFAGIGFGAALEAIGIKELGIESDADVRDTRLAAGMTTISDDVWNLATPHLQLTYRLLTAGPPCQTFSKVGKGHGRQDLDLITGIAASMADGCYALTWLYDTIRALYSRPDADSRTALVLIPLLYIVRDYPVAVVLEQVPAVLPVWEAYALVLRALGYSVETGLVSAEQYGVPQTRRRAVLIANREANITMPRPTHSRYHVRDPKRMDAGVRPWVSMAEALGWEDGVVGFPRKADGRDEGVTIAGREYRSRDLRDTAQPSWGVTSKSRSWMRWAFERPSTTIMHRPAIWEPGHKVNADDIARLGKEEAMKRYVRRNTVDAYRPTIEEVAALQTFPRDFPLAGSMTSQFRQIGNAVPPLLAERLILAALGHDEIGYNRYA